MSDTIHELKINLPFQADGKLQPEVDAATRKLYLDASPSVVQIKVGDASGTGFFLNDHGLVATDAHVVLQGAQMQVTTSTGEKRAARIVALDDIDDLAIVQMDGDTPKGIKPLPIGTKPPAPDDRIWGLGHARGADDTYISPGYFRRPENLLTLINLAGPDELKKVQMRLSGLTPLEKADAKASLLRPTMNSAMNVQPGDSGGPVIDATGSVIGLNDMSNVHSLGEFTPIARVTELLNNNAPKFKFSYQKTDDGWTLTNISRTDGALRAPYVDELVNDDAPGGS